MSNKTFTLMSNDALTKAIESVMKRASKVTVDLQDLAVQCIAQSIVHRCATPAMQLYDAMTAGFRRDAMAKYFELFGNLAWMKDEKKIKFFDVCDETGKSKLVWNDEYEAKVSGFLWHKATKAPENVSMYDVSKEVDKLLERLSKFKTKGKTLKNEALLGVLTRAYRAYEYEQQEMDTSTKHQEDAALKFKEGEQARKKRIKDATKPAATISEASLTRLAEKFNEQPAGAPAMHQ